MYRDRFSTHPSEDYLEHHGILGQHWGKRNGPPYPLKSSVSEKIQKKGKARKDAEYKKQREKLQKTGKGKTEKGFLTDVLNNVANNVYYDGTNYQSRVDTRNLDQKKHDWETANKLSRIAEDIETDRNRVDNATSKWKQREREKSSSDWANTMSEFKKDPYYRPNLTHQQRNDFYDLIHQDPSYGRAYRLVQNSMKKTSSTFNPYSEDRAMVQTRKLVMDSMLGKDYVDQYLTDLDKQSNPGSYGGMTGYKRTWKD